MASSFGGGGGGGGGFKRFVSSPAEVKVGTPGGPRFGSAKSNAQVVIFMNEQISDDYDELKDLLDRELTHKKSGVFRDGWEVAKSWYNQNKSNPSLRALQNRKFPSMVHIACVCYVLESTHKKFNEDTRNVETLSDFKDYRWKSLFKLLQIACSDMVGSPDVYPENCLLYRGFSGKFLDEKIGKRVVFKNYTSATYDKSIAEGYAKKYSPDKFTVFVIQGETPNAIGLEHHLSRENKEVLLSPLNSYIIKEDYTSRGMRYVVMEVEDYLLL